MLVVVDPSTARSFRPSSNLFRTGFDLISNSSLEMYRRWCGLHFWQTVRKHFARYHMALSTRCVSFYESISCASAAEKSQNGICCVVSFVSSALHPNFNNQLLLSQAHAFKGFRECSNRLSFSTAECDRRFCSMRGSGQSSLLCTNDAVPLTPNRSASPAQSEFPYGNTEPTGALFTTSRLSVVGRTVMIPGFPRRYRRIDLMFLMSVSLARPRLDGAFPIAQRKSARSIHNSFPTSCR